MTNLIRSFVAIDISHRARDQVADFIDRLRRQVGGVRWVRPDLLHLTLVFLGEVESTFIEAVKPGLREAAAATVCFPLRLVGVGAFPSPRRARVIWLGMEASSCDELVRLQRAAVRALVRKGFVPEARPFSPHLTIGRLPVPTDVSSLLASQQFESEPFEAERLALYRSVLRTQGPEYSVLATFEFSPRS